MKKRFLLSLFTLTLVLVIVFSVSITGFCASVNMTTYADTLYNNTNIENLLSLRQHEQVNKKYIGFRFSNTEYVLLLSDSFSVSGSRVTAENAELIIYDSSLGVSNSTRYYSVSYPSVTLTVNHVVASNFLEGSSKNETSNYQRNVIIFLVCLLGVIIFWVLRRFK